jgi:hypothetical protein
VNTVVKLVPALELIHLIVIVQLENLTKMENVKIVVINANLVLEKLITVQYVLKIESIIQAVTVQTDISMIPNLQPVSDVLTDVNPVHLVTPVLLALLEELRTKEVFVPVLRVILKPVLWLQVTFVMTLVLNLLALFVTCNVLLVIIKQMNVPIAQETESEYLIVDVQKDSMITLIKFVHLVHQNAKSVKIHKINAQYVLKEE